ncbi:monofunctional biosynthetic peptidoglycan transglycosylase [Halomonas elongata]|uniref:Biosynthetic peptidoglycan transglycosylase n=2 Tax=Halomonas elongata TaxID=2746 RepID=E1V6W8_HALED|nr:monofunctional biosynthetic peptidoglycan transglycosylase [Halomonas elongata]OBX34142.1 penicillin-binding protein 2D [Halomonas elongata]WBF17098.1 monofunctional biosynthetic peptidoglycan transglycosylase [Halomonas elongata]WPU45932.1 monofunctional biosynthetic peptidoglycan transglycosylase [Halomonas elongata DSM 2581]CBV43347.1 biosynthetic peptidoglycan transglycosylase MtgA [Halomonas elongata DSM 2581]
MREWLRRAARVLGLALLGWVGLSVLLVLMFRVVPVGGSMVMVERKVEAWLAGESLDIRQQWRPWSQLSDNAKLAVIAAEDQRFPSHHGFDFVEMRRAVMASLKGSDLRGASTLSQQTAKNLFLWTGRNWVRKGLEAWFTLLIELLWPKERILEVYLNIAEWDNGVFGLEAAAQHYFGVPAAALTPVQASRLAAILPNPRGWSASRPSSYVLQRSDWIRGQMRNLGHAYLERL